MHILYMGVTQKALVDHWVPTGARHLSCFVLFLFCFTQTLPTIYSASKYTHTFSSGSHRTQTPLTYNWADTDTHNFSWGSHRHPLLMAGFTQIPTHSHEVHTDTPLLTACPTQITNTFSCMGFTKTPITFDWATQIPTHSQRGQTDSSQ